MCEYSLVICDSLFALSLLYSRHALRELDFFSQKIWYQVVYTYRGVLCVPLALCCVVRAHVHGHGTASIEPGSRRAPSHTRKRYNGIQFSSFCVLSVGKRAAGIFCCLLFLRSQTVWRFSNFAKACLLFDHSTFAVETQVSFDSANQVTASNADIISSF